MIYSVTLVKVNRQKENTWDSYVCRLTFELSLDALVEPEPVPGVVRVGEEQAKVVLFPQLQVRRHLVEQLLAVRLLLRNTDGRGRTSVTAARHTGGQDRTSDTAALHT